MRRDNYVPHGFFRIVEILAVLATGAARFVVAEWLEFDLFFIVCAIGFWIGFVLLRTRSEPGVLRRWGFTWRWNPRQGRILFPYFAAVLIACYLWWRFVTPAALGASGLGAPAAADFAELGAATASAIEPSNLLATLIFYPFWGVVQQFIVVAMIAGNIGIIVGRPKLRGPIAVVATGIIFALAHLPHPGLVALGFLLGSVATSTYLRWRNLWIIGLFHGWIATFFYYFVLYQDPWKTIVALAQSPW